MKFGEIIFTYYPVLLSRTNQIEPTKKDVDEYIQAIDDILSSRTGPYVFISLDETENHYISSEMRIYLGKCSTKIFAPSL